MNPNDILAQNRESWDAIADTFFGVTALPEYGCFIPSEEELRLFPALAGQKVLDIGCGSGHSLKWCGERGAAELWGLDLSDQQIETAAGLLDGYAYRLFRSPMEQNPGIPEGYFDVVYSIYAIGWTVDMQTTFDLVFSYLKQGGSFIFSWDHPLLYCTEAVGGQILFSGSYDEPEPFTFKKTGKKPAERSYPNWEAEEGVPLTLYNRRFCDYINALAKAGFRIERLVEETDRETLDGEPSFSTRYYSPWKAKRFLQSFVICARKL